MLYGISIAPGYSILYKSNSSPIKIVYREKFGGEIKQREFKKTSVNIGISFTYMGSTRGAFWIPLPVYIILG